MPKVLVVDDAKGVHEMMATLFTTMDVEAIHATSATEALEVFKREKVDVVLTDVRMERIDGITFLRKLKKVDDAAVVIVMTAFDRKEDILAALKLGAFDFFIKPFSVNDFKDSLARAFEERERRDAALGGENAEALALLRGQLEEKEAALKAREEALAAAEKAGGSGGGKGKEGDSGSLKRVLAAREKAVEEAEAAVAKAQAEIERKLLAIDDFSSFDGSAPAPKAAPPPEPVSKPSAHGDESARLQALAEREVLLAEREAYLEQSENALFEKGQSLQELETELEHMRDHLESQGAKSGPAPVSKEAAAEIEAEKAELAAKARDLEKRERELKDGLATLAKREKQLARSEALVRAREKYLEASESILFEKED
ncbi:MAG: response regulator [Opitutales bacterium]|nr:response regulator [Opitutales bacterium]